MKIKEFVLENCNNMIKENGHSVYFYTKHTKCLDQYKKEWFRDDYSVIYIKEEDITLFYVFDNYAKIENEQLAIETRMTLDKQIEMYNYFHEFTTQNDLVAGKKVGEFFELCKAFKYIEQTLAENRALKDIETFDLATTLY